MERLCKLNTATLSTRTHLASKPTQITLNHVYRSFKVTHFEITEMPTRVCVLLYNNVGFRVGNFKGKFRASPYYRTSPSFGAPYLGNTCEYSHKLYISRNWNHWPTFCCFVYLHSYVSGRLCTTIFPQECISAIKVIQGHWFRHQSKARMRLPITPS